LQAKAKIMVIQDIERDDIEFISKTLGCLPIAHVDNMRPEKLGSAELVKEVDVRRPFVTSIVQLC
jgi:T-complex protein 1 subunit delta